MILKRIVVSFIILFLAGFLGLFFIFQYFSHNLPSYDELANYNPPSVTRIYSADGKLLQEYAKERRVFVPIDNVPSSLIQAFVAAEDKNFYKHPGIDISGLFRAILHNTINIIRNKRMEGASTIPQQVVKIFFLSPERSLKRKIKEAILSFKISQVYTKDKILELYLNQTFFGKGSYGVASAAKQYFNKALEDLDLSESAMLAALPKFPSVLSNLTSENLYKAKGRRDYVLRRMAEDGYISYQSAAQAASLPIILNKPGLKDSFQADGYTEVVRKKVIEMFGEEVFYKDGLTIITPLNSNYQRQAQQSFIQGIKKFDKRQGFLGPIAQLTTTLNWQEELRNYTSFLSRITNDQVAVVLKVLKDKILVGINGKTPLTTYLGLEDMKWAIKGDLAKKFKIGDIIVLSHLDNSYNLSQIPKVDGAMLIMDTTNGKVLAMVSGYDAFSSKFDRATQAQRQPGSLIKPFVYLAALEQSIEPNTIFVDEPIQIYQGPGLPIYSPQNYGKNFLGPITMRTALEKSRNTVTVQIAKTVGLGKVAETIARYGINQNPQNFYSMALGSIETTLSKITSAYGSIANGCNLIEPNFIELIKNKNGQVIYKRDNRKCIGCSDELNESLPQIEEYQEGQVLSDDASCYQITSMLQGCMERGTGNMAKKLGKVIAGKTGTTNDSMDAWFVGFTPKIVVGTYVGFDQPKTLGSKATGANVALPIFIDFMQNAFKDEPSIDFAVPNSVSLVHIDPNTGEKTFPQEGQLSILEAFKKLKLYEPVNDPFNKLDNYEHFEGFDIY